MICAPTVTQHKMLSMFYYIVICRKFKGLEKNSKKITLSFSTAYNMHGDNRKVSQIISVQPYCITSSRPGAINCIYSYIKSVYN